MNDIVKRVNFRLKHLYTFRYFLNQDVKEGMVHALVQPIFDYGDYGFLKESLTICIFESFLIECALGLVTPIYS
jgi:hypothetical protein